MNPGVLTPAERRDLVHASLFGAVNKPMPADPDLRFTVDMGLRRRPVDRMAA